jgi:DNA-directed RNA polymerase subunit M/transcription elongation factor TFIIS
MNVDGVRQKVAARFAETLGDEHLGKKLEIVLWNHTLRQCQAKQYPLEWSSALGTDSLRELYTQRAISLDVYNLKTNEPLRNKLQSGELGLKKFVDMKPWEMNPEMWTPIFERVAFKALRKQLSVDVANAPDGAFTCGNCKSLKTTYYQLQTRSADGTCISAVLCPKFTPSLRVFFFYVCRTHDLFYPVPFVWKTVEAIGFICVESSGFIFCLAFSKMSSAEAEIKALRKENKALKERLACLEDQVRVRIKELLLPRKNSR